MIRVSRQENQALNDSRLSFKARGIMAMLLTKPDGCEVAAADLCHSGPDGRASVESGLNELKQFGYITTIEQPRGAGGRFGRGTRGAE